MKEDLELVRMIRDGQDEQEAFAELLRHFKAMIYKIIYMNNLEKGDFRIDENDLFQEGSLALYRAVKNYEEGRNVRFSSYAFMVIRSRIREVLRTAYRSYGDELSLDTSIDYSLKFCVREDPAGYHREECFREELKAFMDSLNEEDRKIFELKRQDMTYEQIAERLNITSKRLDNRLRILRKMLKKYLNRISMLAI
ncbi:MAG: sigma-70 family RNA polymerase sigma factor [Erysipelotrichaceae bacterium]|jgi:RNA polymerase sporulation-specific sigma factor|nr:sigma-70 family RNA polymerase sigma factor [Erysipelotrichaceae bacterium]